MKTLNSLSVILPKETNDGVKLNFDNLLTGTANLIGGYTLRDVKGGWVDEGKLYSDESYELVMASDSYDLLRTAFTRALSFLRFDGEQLACSVVVDGQMFILEDEDFKEFKQINLCIDRIMAKAFDKSVFNDSPEREEELSKNLIAFEDMTKFELIEKCHYLNETIFELESKLEELEEGEEVE